MSPLASLFVSPGRGLARSFASRVRGAARLFASLARGPARSSLSRARGPARWDAVSCVVVLVLGVCASSARADASVIVELKRADGSSADGLVRLSKGDARHECTTKNGRCQIDAVPGGTYNVEVVQADKPASKPKRVMIPPAGEVKLIVAAQ